MLARKRGVTFAGLSKRTDGTAPVPLNLHFLSVRGTRISAGKRKLESCRASCCCQPQRLPKYTSLWLPSHSNVRPQSSCVRL